MRNFLLPALMLIVALTFFQRPAQAQQSTENAETNKPKTANSELREKAFAMLESLAGQLNTLQSAENRARIGANLAESLWPRDKTRARALFLLVQEDIRSHLTIPVFEDETERQTFLVFLKLRSDTLDRIIKYDAELAYSFFKATEVDLDNLPPYLFEEERKLDLRLSQKLAAQNPDVAVRLARRALERGFPEELLMILGRLGKKHQAQMQVLYKQIVQKLRNADLKEDEQARAFISAIARYYQPPIVDELVFRDLVGVVTATSAANGCDRKPAADDDDYLCQWASAVLSTVGKSDSAGRARQRTPEDNEDDRRGQHGRALEELEETAEEGSVDDILALLNKYPNLADDIYWRAMRKARNEGDVDRMRKIAEEYKGNPQLRYQMLEVVAHAQRQLSFDEEQLAQVQEQLAATPQLQQRVTLLLQAVYRAGASNPKTALKLLNQAEQLIETMKPGKQQSRDQLLLAMLYCLEKQERGFAMMESLVPKLNMLVDAAVRLDGYDTSYLREGEWNMSAAGHVGDLLTDLARFAEIFAWSDFDRAMNLAAQFERPELRMMAQMKLAQGILAGPHKRQLIGRGY